MKVDYEKKKKIRNNKYQYLWKKIVYSFVSLKTRTYERPFSLDNNYSLVQAPYRGVFSVSEITTFRLDSIF